MNLDLTEAKPSFEIANRRPKKISTMTRDAAKRHSPEAEELHRRASAEISLPKITKESFDDVPELRSRTVTNASSSTTSTRRSRKSPGELMRMLNQDAPSSTKPKKKKKEKNCG